MDVEIPWELVERERRRLVGTISKTARVPGFRKGKAPEGVLVRHFEPEIREALEDSFIPQYVAQEVTKRDVEPATGPYIGEIHYLEGAPLRVHAEFEVFPKFELGEYRGLRIPQVNTDVDDELVEIGIEGLRKRHATYQNLDPRPIVDGDIVATSIKGFLEDGSLVIESEQTYFEVGSEDSDQEVSELLVGKVPGDNLEFRKTADDEHPDQRIAGKKVNYQVEVTGLTKRELPELDDEFAKEVDERFESLEALRGHMRETIEESLARSAQQQESDQVCQELAIAHPMPMPPAYMTNRGLEALRQAKRDIEGDSKGVVSEDDAKYILGREEIRVRAELVLDRIAMVEGISVSDAEVAEDVQRFAQSNQLTPQKAYEALQSEGLLPRFEMDRRRAKTIAFVLAEADRRPSDETGPVDDTPQPEGQAESAE